jgi:hypothetical protein
MARPNLFIVGAPKCGTTSLAAYLRTHPDIFVSNPKEPHFFAVDLPRPHPRNFIYDENKYLELFSGSDKRTVRCEASTWYLYTPGAADRIKRFSSDARIIIMVRHPVDMMFSLYSHRKYAGDEDAPTFEEAVGLEAMRKQGKYLPKNLTHTVLGLFYRELAHFSVPVQYYMDVFGRDHVHIVDFERFKHDTATEYTKVLEFLQVSSEVPRNGFAVFNENKRRYNRFFYRFIDDRISAQSKRAFKRVFGDSRATKLKGVFKAAVPSFKQESLRAETARQLEDEFAKEIRNLSLIAQIDLSAWRKYSDTQEPQ